MRLRKYREAEAGARLEKFAAFWDPRKHPRGGNPDNTGQFSRVPGVAQKDAAGSSTRFKSEINRRFPRFGYLSDAEALQFRIKAIAEIEAQVEDLTREASEWRNLLRRNDLLGKRDELLAKLRLYQNGTDFAINDNYTLVPINENGTRLLGQFLHREVRIQQIARMGAREKFGEVLDRLIGNEGYKNLLGQELIERLKELRDPTNLALMVGITGVVAGLQFTPAGPAIDAVIGLLGLVLFGKEALEISQDLSFGIIGTLAAKTDRDFDEAAHYLARGLSKAALDAGFVAAGKGAGKGLKSVKQILAERKALKSLTRLTKRADEVHSLLHPIARKQRTTAVLETNGADIIGGGKRDLTPAQRASLQKGEIAAELPNEHAEITVLQEAARRGFRPRAISSTRDFCPECQTALKEAGARITGPRTAVGD